MAPVRPEAAKDLGGAVEPLLKVYSAALAQIYQPEEVSRNRVRLG